MKYSPSNLEPRIITAITIAINIHTILIVVVESFEAHELLILSIGFFLNHDAILDFTVL